MVADDSRVLSVRRRNIHISAHEYVRLAFVVTCVNIETMKAAFTTLRLTFQWYLLVELRDRAVHVSGFQINERRLDYSVRRSAKKKNWNQKDDWTLWLNFVFLTPKLADKSCFNFS